MRLTFPVKDHNVDSWALAFYQHGQVHFAQPTGLPFTGKLLRSELGHKPLRSSVGGCWEQYAKHAFRICPS
jgi:hypothetical protein